MTVLKLEAFGTSTGAVLPEEMLARMNLKAGDMLFAVETPNGYLLTPYDPEAARQIEIGQSFMERYSQTFRRLAK